MPNEALVQDLLNHAIKKEMSSFNLRLNEILESENDTELENYLAVIHSKIWRNAELDDLFWLAAKEAMKRNDIHLTEVLIRTLSKPNYFPLISENTATLLIEAVMDSQISPEILKIVLPISEMHLKIIYQEKTALQWAEYKSKENSSDAQAKEKLQILEEGIKNITEKYITDINRWLLIYPEKTEEGIAYLYSAVFANDLKKIERLLFAVPTLVNYHLSYSSSEHIAPAFIQAITFNMMPTSIETLDLLLKQPSIDLEIRHQEKTALQWAIQNCLNSEDETDKKLSFKKFQLLMKYNPIVDTTSSDILFVMLHNDIPFSMLKDLLTLHPKINLTGTYKNKTLLEWAIENGTSLEKIKLLLKISSLTDINIISADISPVVLAAKNSHWDAMKYLLDTKNITSEERNVLLALGVSLKYFKKSHLDNFSIHTSQQLNEAMELNLPFKKISIDKSCEAKVSSHQQLDDLIKSGAQYSLLSPSESYAEEIGSQSQLWVSLSKEPVTNFFLTPKQYLQYICGLSDSKIKTCLLEIHSNSPIHNLPNGDMEKFKEILLTIKNEKEKNLSENKNKNFSLAREKKSIQINNTLKSVNEDYKKLDAALRSSVFTPRKLRKLLVSILPSALPSVRPGIFNRFFSKLIDTLPDSLISENQLRQRQERKQDLAKAFRHLWESLSSLDSFTETELRQVENIIKSHAFIFNENPNSPIFKSFFEIGWYLKRLGCVFDKSHLLERKIQPLLYSIQEVPLEDILIVQDEENQNRIYLYSDIIDALISCEDFQNPENRSKKLSENIIEEALKNSQVQNAVIKTHEAKKAKLGGDIGEIRGEIIHEIELLAEKLFGNRERPENREQSGFDEEKSKKDIEEMFKSIAKIPGQIECLNAVSFHLQMRGEQTNFTELFTKMQSGGCVMVLSDTIREYIRRLKALRKEPVTELEKYIRAYPPAPEKKLDTATSLEGFSASGSLLKIPLEKEPDIQDTVLTNVEDQSSVLAVEDRQATLTAAQNIPHAHPTLQLQPANPIATTGNTSLAARNSAQPAATTTTRRPASSAAREQAAPPQRVTNISSSPDLDSTDRNAELPALPRLSSSMHRFSSWPHLDLEAGVSGGLKRGDDRAPWSSSQFSLDRALTPATSANRFFGYTPTSDFVSENDFTPASTFRI